MRRLPVLLLLTVLMLAVAAPALAAGPAAPPPGALLSPGSQLPPTAPAADFNEAAQSSSWIVSTLHMRGPEKIIAAAVTLLLLAALVMFAGMLRQVYGGPRAGAPRR